MEVLMVEATVMKEEGEEAEQQNIKVTYSVKHSKPLTRLTQRPKRRYPSHPKTKYTHRDR